MQLFLIIAAYPNYPLAGIFPNYLTYKFPVF